MEREFESILTELKNQGLDTKEHLFEVTVKKNGVVTHVTGDVICGFLNPKDYLYEYKGPNTPETVLKILAEQEQAQGVEPVKPVEPEAPSELPADVEGYEGLNPAKAASLIRKHEVDKQMLEALLGSSKAGLVKVAQEKLEALNGGQA